LHAIRRDEKTLQLIDYIGEKDISAVLDERGGASIAGLWALPVTRRQNAIRYWTSSFGLPLPGDAMLEKALDGLQSSRPDGAPLLTWQGVCLRRHGDHIFLTGQTPGDSTNESYSFESENTIQMPGGILTADLVKGRGLAIERLDQIEIRLREGGEKLYLGRHRTLKNLFQESGLPAWLREFVPLAYAGGELVAIAGLPAWRVPMVIAGGKVAGRGQTGVELSFKMPNQPYSH
jgi:tRNA(Ile)-lysidine synthase